MSTQKTVEYILRIAIFGTFLGHGVLALGILKGWIPLIMAFGFSEAAASGMLPIIGGIDIIVAIFALLRPVRIVLIWAAFWAFTTAIARPIAGTPVWDFVERSANWGAPLALLYLQGLPKNIKDIFTVR